MGKADNLRLPVLQQQSSRTFLCQRCPMGVYRLFNFKCAVIFLISITAFLSALFSVIPLRYRQAGFDAKDSIKLSATVQAYFRLQKPISELVPYISRLEYDVNGEIGVYSSKVVVLSMHQASVSNCTNVVFGFLPDPINSTIYPVSLSLLKSSLIDLFFQQYNLTLTSIFGELSSFEILKFPGGITIIPEQSAMILQIHQVLFNFTLDSSIYEIKENLPELKEQLKLGLHLMPDEVVSIQVTNKRGSTKDSPITVDSSVVSNLGTLLPERLRQLAQIITGSLPTENLGLNHSVFGKVKEISLSSFLNHSIHAPTPTPSPSQSPELSYDTGPSLAPSYSPAFSPNSHHSLLPCPNCFTSAPSASHPSAPSPHNVPHYYLSPMSDSPAPSVAHGSTLCGSADPPSPSPTSHLDQVSANMSPSASSESPLAGSTPQISPSLSPLPGVAYGSRGPDKRSGKVLASPPHVSSSFALSQSC